MDELMPEHSTAVAAFERRKAIEKKYGLEVTYSVMLERQGGICAICGDQPDPAKRRFAIDHCHTANVVRGILCGKCNVAIGLMGDDPERLIAAAAYLQRSIPKHPKHKSPKSKTSRKVQTIRKTLADGTVKVYRYENGVRTNP